jgi:UDP-GlcNAc:undecaprenyl-phosphate GlcNAc-1-phosphate transferase
MIFLSFVFSFLFAAFALCLAVKFFPRLGLLDKPSHYGLKREPIPYFGGVVIALTVLVAVALLYFSDFLPSTVAGGVETNSLLIGLFISGLLIAVLGFLDDYFKLGPLLRIVFQALAAVNLILFGIGIEFINLPFIGGIDLGVLAGFFTVLWVMTLINAVNFVDGVRGLSSGVGFIAGLVILALSLNPLVNDSLEMQLPVAILAAIFAGACLAFFLFEFPKQKILLGDTGSTFIGFMIAVLAIFSGGKVATAFLVMALPLLDMVWVILRRLLSHGRFWKGDRKHLHHRLLDVGFTESGVIAIYLSFTFVFGFSAVLLVDSKQKFFMILAVALIMIVLALMLLILPKLKKMK